MKQKPVFFTLVFSLLSLFFLGIHQDLIALSNLSAPTSAQESVNLAQSTATATHMPVDTTTATATPTATAVETQTPTATATATFTPTATATATSTPTATATATSTPTATATATSSPTPTPTPTNAPPSISQIDDQVIDEDSSTGEIFFTVTDEDSPANELAVTAVSNNQTLVPNATISLGGIGENRTISISPAANQFGSATITVTVNDGAAQTSSSFLLQVNPINDPPSLDLNGPGGGTGFAATFSTSGDPVQITGSGLQILDADNPQMVSATAIISNLLDGSAEILSVNTAGTAISANYNSGVLTLTGLDSIENYGAVLRSATYQNNSNSPSLANRKIDFSVYDGANSSNTARSTVTLLDPRIKITITPETQTIASGGSAIFVINVQNSGNTALNYVFVNDELATNCNKYWSALSPGETRSYSCNRTHVTAEFLNQVDVSAQDPLGNNIFHSDTARVEVENPNVTIVKGPFTQTVRRGETAFFNILVLNTSSTVDLIDVEVIDPLTPDCNRTGNHNFSNLDADTEEIYTCSLSNISAAFTNVITITGKNILTNDSVQDSSIAYVELMDLGIDVQASPTELVAPGGPVTFTVTVSNPGSVDLSLLSLSSERFGDLTNPANSLIQNSDCDQLNSEPILSDGGIFSCTFINTFDELPGDYTVQITAVAEDVAGSEISASTTTIIEVINSEFELQMSSQYETIPAPGGMISFTLDIINDNPTASIAVNSLTDSVIGDLDGQGNCNLPQQIASQTVYSCSYMAEVYGNIDEVHLRTVVASGISDNGHAVTATDDISILFIDPEKYKVMLPFVRFETYPPGESNDRSCIAHYVKLMYLDKRIFQLCQL